MNYKKWLSFCSIFLILIIGFTIVILNLGYTTIEPKISPMPNPSDIALPVAPSGKPLPSPKLSPSPNPAPYLNPLSSSSATPDIGITHSEGIRVYGDYSNELTEIDWGTVTLGVIKNTQISVLNIGDKPIILYLSAINWTPGVNGTITWNYDDTVVPANATTPITLSLKIESANVTAFNNNIIIGFTNA